MKTDEYFEYQAKGSPMPMPQQFENQGAAGRWKDAYAANHPEHASKLEMFKVTVTTTREAVNNG